MLDIRDKLKEIYSNFLELEKELAMHGVMSDMSRYKKLSKEYAHLKDVCDLYKKWERVETDLKDNKELLREEKDPEMLDMIKEEISALEKSDEELQKDLQIILLPKDPLDEKNAILEIRAGTGGAEAALFSADIFRMYSRYAENKGWKTEIMSMSEAEGNGLKEVIVLIKGKDVYGSLKYEGGVHRVQRVPATEAQGRIHTSAITVAVLPEAEEIDEIEIDEKELKIDVYRSSGAGGQHVNTTDSAVRITHIPTNIVVACQDERSQIQNRVKAMKILMAKLLQKKQEELQDSISSKRKALVGSGDRSEKIRTYNYPQSRVTDHRIGLTLYRLADIMEGTLDMLIEPLIAYQNAELLKTETE